MSINSITITSTKDRNRFAIGEPITFTVTGSGVSGSESVKVELRKANNTAVLTKTFTLTSGSPSATDTFYDTETINLKTSRHSGTGNYYLYAYSVATPVKNYKHTEWFCDILSIWMIRNAYGAGLVAQRGDDYNIQSAIERAYGIFELETRMPLWPKRVLCSPNANQVVGTDFDLYGEQRTLFRKSPGIAFEIILNWKRINTINAVKGYLGNGEVQSYQAETFKFDRKKGVVFWLPFNYPASTLTGLSLSLLTYTQFMDSVPRFWYIDYYAGYDENKETYDGYIRNLVARIAILELARPSMDGANVSQDGVTEAFNFTAFEAALKKEIAAYNQRERGIILGSLH